MAKPNKKKNSIVEPRVNDEIRGYDTILDPILDAHIPDLPFEDEVRFDPDGLFYLLLDARSGKVINYYSDD